MFLSKLHVIRPKTLATRLKTTIIASTFYFIHYSPLFFSLISFPFSIFIFKQVDKLYPKKFHTIKLLDLINTKSVELCSITRAKLFLFLIIVFYKLSFSKIFFFLMTTYDDLSKQVEQLFLPHSSAEY